MIKKCMICGDDFLLKSGNQLTCNNKNCKKERNKQKKIERLKDPIYKENIKIKKIEYSRNYYMKHKKGCIENSKKLRYDIICKECGSNFLGYSKKLVYCCKKCEIINLKKRIGKNNPSYRNGLYIKGKKKIHNYKYKLYERNCKVLDEKLINEVGFLYCEHCGITNPLRFEHHHLVYRSEKPKHEHLHDIDNIYHLCIKCHNEFHKHKGLRNNIVEERKLNNLFGDDILNK